MTKITYAMSEILADLNGKYDLNLNNDKEFKTLLWGLNYGHRNGVIPQRGFWLAIFGLYCYKTQIQKINESKEAELVC